MNLKTALGQFRAVAIAEGVSFLVLLFIAMPLKYMAGLPLFVKYIGWAHGLLFVLYLVCLLRVRIEHNWSLKEMALAVAASLLPFGPFVLENSLRKAKL